MKCMKATGIYNDIVEKRVGAMHERGKPHDSTLLYGQCGRNILLLVRTIARSRQLGVHVKKTHEDINTIDNDEDLDFGGNNGENTDNKRGKIEPKVLFKS